MKSRAGGWLWLGTVALAAGCSASGVVSGGTTGRAPSGSGATGSGSNGASSAATASGGSTGAKGGSTGKTGGNSSGGSPTSNGGSNGGSSAGSGGAASSSSGGTYYGVLERANDAMRDAVFVDAALTKTALPSLQVDPVFSSPANAWNGPVFSQPLYFVNQIIGHDLVIVTTDSNEIWALDAVTGNTVWSVPALTPSIDTSLMECNGSVSPIGITGTPVIDPSTRTMYLNAGTVVAGNPHYQIYGIDLDDGSTVSPTWPIDVEGTTVNYAGGTTKFSSMLQNQRGALALLNGILYIPYGGLDGDCGEYRGVVLSVPLANPTQVSGWETAAPSGGGIWGPSGVDSDGTSVFVSTGNTNADPNFPTLWPDANSEAVIRLAAGNPPTFSGDDADYMAPSDPMASGCNSTACGWYQDDEDDADLGSSGVVLFNVTGANPSDLAFAIGKTGNGYLVQRSSLGGIGTGVSEIAGASNQVFGSMAAYTSNGITYVVANANSNGTCNGNMATFTVSPTSPPQLGAGWCTNSGGTGSPIVSTSNGTDDYVVWGLGGNLDAIDGDSGKTLVSLSVGNYTHWVTPIIAKGAVYVAGNNQVYKFSLPPQ